MQNKHPCILGDVKRCIFVFLHFSITMLSDETMIFETPHSLYFLAITRARRKFAYN